MSKSALIKEHNRLIKVLESGDSKAQKKEALDQMKEMNKYM